jgi:hypothetical protein
VSIPSNGCGCTAAGDELAAAQAGYSTDDARQHAGARRAVALGLRSRSDETRIEHNESGHPPIADSRPDMDLRREGPETAVVLR